MAGPSSAIQVPQQRRAGLEREIEKIDGILEALRGLGAGPTQVVRGAKSTGGKWRPGRPGRPPKWYTEGQKGKAAKKPTGKKAKLKASPKQLDAMTRARAALAERRAAAK